MKKDNSYKTLNRKLYIEEHEPCDLSTLDED